MTKYYRVKKDTFLWKEGAIISMEDGDNGYDPIEDVWNVVESQCDWITKEVVEANENREYFERVYKDNLKGNIFRTADKVREVYEKKFK